MKWKSSIRNCATGFCIIHCHRYSVMHNWGARPRCTSEVHKWGAQQKRYPRHAFHEREWRTFGRQRSNPRKVHGGRNVKTLPFLPLSLAGISGIFYNHVLVWLTFSTYWRSTKGTWSQCTSPALCKGRIDSLFNRVQIRYWILNNDDSSTE